MLFEFVTSSDVPNHVSKASESANTFCWEPLLARFDKELCMLFERGSLKGKKNRKSLFPMANHGMQSLCKEVENTKTAMYCSATVLLSDYRETNKELAWRAKRRTELGVQL